MLDEMMPGFVSAERREVGARLRSLLDEYGRSFDEAVRLRQARDAAQATMSPMGPRALEYLSRAMTSAFADSDAVAAERAAAAQETLLLARLSAARLRENWSQARPSSSGPGWRSWTGTSRRWKRSSRIRRDGPRRPSSAGSSRATRRPSAFVQATVRHEALVTGDVRRTAEAFFDASSGLGEKQRAALAASQAAGEAQFASPRTTNLAIAGGALLLGMLLAWCVSTSIVRGVGGMRLAMSRLAEGDLEAAISERDSHRHEFGRVAAAVQVFQDSARRVRTLKAEAEAEKTRAEAGKRAAMLELAAGFERTVGGVVEGIVTAAGDLQHAATGFVAAAERSSHQTGAVTVASQEASESVRTVAAATEELTVSIREINARVNETAQVALSASACAAQTDETMTA